MQTFVAFASATPIETTARVARVGEHYAALHAEPASVRILGEAAAGVVVWETPVIETSWPLVAERPGRAVVSSHPPLRVENIVSTWAENAPFDLVDVLRRNPERIFDITPPFVAAAVEGGDLDLFTDALGVGRLFEVRTPWGWVWSNRPLAALLFADLPVRPDPMGWAQSAVADEMFGATSPFAGVRVVGPATRVHWDGRAARLTRSSLDVTTGLLTPDPEARAEDLTEEAAADLVAATASISRWYPGTPVVDLSGGRDSRLVAAGFLAGGTEVTLHSHDAMPGDLMVAQDLVERLGRDVEHRVTHMATGATAPPRPFAACESARAWHAYAEGLRPCSYLHYAAPTTLDRTGSVVVGGAGGESAHGFYYVPADTASPVGFEEDLVAALDDPARAHQVVRDFARRIVQRHCPVPGVTAQAREGLIETLAAELTRIRQAGVAGATLLDHVYLAERMRRWGSTAERHGIASPLLTPSFQRAALAMRPHERRDNVLHRRLTERLVPQWTGVPYFPGEMPEAVTKRTTPPRVIRLADCLDADDVEAVLASPDQGTDPFDGAVLADYWRMSVAGTSTAAQERLLRSAVWRAGFEDLLADVAGRPRSERSGTIPAIHEPLPETAAPGMSTQVSAWQPRSARPAGPQPQPQPTQPTQATVPVPPAPDPTLTAVLLQTEAVRRLGRSAAWRAIRETAPGRALRSAISRRR